MSELARYSRQVLLPEAGMPGQERLLASSVAAVALGGATNRRTGHQLEGDVDYLERIGMEAVRAHERTLTEAALEGLQAIDGVCVYGPLDPSQRSGVVAFTVEGNDAHLVAQLLNDEGIAVRSGDHCGFPLADRLAVEGTVQVSFNIYNTLDEVERFLNALEDIVCHKLL